MIIRKMKRSDIENVMKLISQLAHDLGEEFVVEYEKFNVHFTEMNRFPELYVNFVACEDDRITGFVSLVLYRSFLHEKGTALINELVVSKDFRNREIGTKLLQHAIDYAREMEMDEIEVGVMNSNKKAISFYRKNGIDEEYLLLGKEF